MSARCLVFATALVAGISGTAAAQAPAGAGRAPERHLVIPFESDSSDPRASWIGEASAAIITDDLSALGAAVIARDDRLRAFDRLRVPAVATLSHATVIRLGQVVGAAHVVVGRFDLNGEELTVRVRTIRLDAGRMSEEIVERGALSDLFGTYARVARRIVPGSSVTIEQMEQDHPTPAAFEQYIKGLLAESPAVKVAYLAEAIRLAPSFRRPRLALWNVHHEQGEHREALAAVREIPEEHRLGRPARFLGAISMLHLEQFAESFEALQRLNEGRRDPALLNNLGVVQLRRAVGSPSGRAVPYFDEAARLDPTNADIHFNLGYAAWLEGDTASAITWLREAVRRDAADAEAHYVLGVALLSSGSVTEGNREKELAKRLSADVTQLDSLPGANAVRRGLARVLTDIDVPAALRVEAALVEAGQRDQQELAQFHLDAGRRLAAAERDLDAINELRRAVYLAPYESEAHLLLGRLYLRNARAAEALDALKIAVWSDDTIQGRLAMAEAYLALKDDASARSELEGVLRRDPGNAGAQRMLASLGQEER